MIAESCESLLRDIHLNDKAKELYKKSPATANKIKEILSKLYQKLKEIYAKLKPQSVEANLVLQMKDALGEIQDKFIEGINAATKNLRNMDVTETGSKLQGRGSEYADYDKSVIRADVDTIHDIGRIKGKISVNQFTSKEIQATQKWAHLFYQQLGEKSPFFRAWFGDWRANERTPVTVAKNRGSQRGKVKNVDTGWKINVSSKVFNETYVHQGNNNIPARAYIPFINDIVKNAVLLDTVVSDKFDTEDSLFMHSFYAIADIGYGKELIKLYIEELNNPNSNVTTKRAYQLQNIENQQLTAKGSQKNSASPVTTAADVKTISDLFELVKQKDGIKFNPNPASKVVDKSGKPLVVYHGTLANDISAFNKEFIGDRFSYDDRGFFFTSNKTLANDYATSEFDSSKFGKVIPCYINLQKPLVIDSKWMKKNGMGVYFNKNDAIDFWDSYSAFAWEEADKVRADGIIVNDGMNTMVVAQEPEQIKSVDNIGTFERTNRIRYQFRDSGDFGWDTEDDSIENIFAKDYVTHHEDIGEVLSNISDIDIAPKASGTNSTKRLHLGVQPRFGLSSALTDAPSAGFSDSLSRLSTERNPKRSDYSSAKYLMVRTIWEV